MPSTTNQKFVDIDVVSHPYGAGGEPLGEPTGTQGMTYEIGGGSPDLGP
jgi:hypothetical protein